MRMHRRVPHSMQWHICEDSKPSWYTSIMKRLGTVLAVIVLSACSGSATLPTVKQEPSSDSGSAYSRPSDEEIRQMLSPIQYNVTQHEGTEPAFDNEYWDVKEQGIYVDVVTGEPLFSSLDKYDSGTSPSRWNKRISLRRRTTSCCCLALRCAASTAIVTWVMCLTMDRSQQGFGTV
jgi:hypothetical protein